MAAKLNKSTELKANMNGILSNLFTDVFYDDKQKVDWYAEVINVYMKTELLLLVQEHESKMRE